MKESFVVQLMKKTEPDFLHYRILGKGKREKRARDQRSYQRGSKNESIIESEIRRKWSRMCVL